LRAELNDVPGAIVLFVAACPLVFLDNVRLVFVDRKAPRDTGLLVPSHPQTIEIERRRLVEHQRSALPQGRKIGTGFLVHLWRVGVGSRRYVDFGTGHMQKAERIAVGKVTRFVRRHHVVRDRRDRRSLVRRRPQGAERMDGSHPIILGYSRTAEQQSADGFAVRNSRPASRLSTYWLLKN